MYGSGLVHSYCVVRLYFIEFVDLNLYLPFCCLELQDYKVLTQYADARGGGEYNDAT